MPNPPTVLERAFALAKSGECDGVHAVRVRLQSEGYNLAQLQGPTLLRQLRALCAAAQPVEEPGLPEPNAQ